MMKKLWNSQVIDELKINETANNFKMINDIKIKGLACQSFVMDEMDELCIVNVEES